MKLWVENIQPEIWHIAGVKTYTFGNNYVPDTVLRILTMTHEVRYSYLQGTDEETEEQERLNNLP